MSKVVPMSEAVGRLVGDGDSVAIEGFAHLICHAAGHELIRQRRRGPALQVLPSPRHPYTEALLSAVSVPHPDRRRRRIILTGKTCDPTHLPEGCRFHPRRPRAFDRCRRVDPPSAQVALGHRAACLLADSGSNFPEGER